MAQTYKFQISLPVTDTLARNRIVNAIHLQHVSGGLLDTDLEDVCGDLAAMYLQRYGDPAREVQVKAYDVDAVPNYPRADVVVNEGAPHGCNSPREIALCLSFAGPNRGNRRQRGRIYLAPGIISTPCNTDQLRPAAGDMNWALGFYTTPNGSFPDIGGVDWKFGIWSKTAGAFTQATQAWVNDDWDVQRRRGLRESTRVQAIREG